MPELPEVETMKQALLDFCNQPIKEVTLHCNKLRRPFNSSFVSDIQNNCIKNIIREGKYLIFKLSNKKCLLMHAGMSGKFIINKSEPSKNNHIIITFSNNSQIIYNDPRRFGLALTFNSLKDAQDYINLGIDALNPQLTPDKLHQLLQSRKCDIKKALLNQKIISGIGNIYACEILFYSKIHPESVSCKLPKQIMPLLLQNIRSTLERSIELGGSTLKDYQAPNGDLGYFQTTFAVYGKHNQACASCGTPIEKINQSQRSTFFCPSEQVLYK